MTGKASPLVSITLSVVMASFSTLMFVWSALRAYNEGNLLYGIFAVVFGMLTVLIFVASDHG